MTFSLEFQKFLSIPRTFFFLTVGHNNSGNKIPFQKLQITFQAFELSKNEKNHLKWLKISKASVLKNVQKWIKKTSATFLCPLFISFSELNSE